MKHFDRGQLLDDRVAAVGPIVTAELGAIGVQVNVTPQDNKFFMKPLIRELAAALAREHKG